MNERIKELAEQARLLTGWPVGEIEYQKFAELMSAEFIGILKYEIALCEKYKDTACNDFDRTWQQGKIVHFNKLIEKTKDHFGVEE